MARSTQDAFEALLDITATQHGAELRIDRQWANTGTYTIARPESFRPLVRVTFDWQTTHEGTHVSGRTVPELPGLNAHDYPDNAYHLDGHELDRLLGAIEQRLELEA